MAVTGFDAERMAAISGLAVGTVRNLLSGDNQKFARLKATHEQRVLSAQVLHEMWLEDHIEDAHKAVMAAMGQTADKRLAAEQGWKLLDRARPKPKEAESGPEVTVNIRAAAEFNDTVIAMGKQFIELTEALATQDPNKHVLTGAQALPRAISASAAPEAVNKKVDLDPE